MSYESYTLGLHILYEGKPMKSPMDPREPKKSQQGTNNGQIGDLNPFWVGTRLICIATLVEFIF